VNPASPETIGAELRQVLRALKLSGVLTTLPERLALASQSNLPSSTIVGSRRAARARARAPDASGAESRA
jgi:hypothetical protein